MKKDNYQLDLLKGQHLLINTLDIFSREVFVVAEADLLGIGCIKCKKLIIEFGAAPFRRQPIICPVCGETSRVETLSNLPDPLFYVDKEITKENTINWYFSTIWSKEAVKTLLNAKKVCKPIDKDIYNKMKDIYETTYR